MIKDSTLSMGSRFITATGKFLAYIFIARSVSIEGFGAYSLLLTVSTIITIISLFGYNHAIINVNSRFKKKKLVNSASLIYTLFLAISLFIMIFFFSIFFVASETGLFLGLLTFSQIIYSNGTSILIANSKLNLVFYSSLISNILFLSLCIISDSTDYKTYIMFFSICNILLLLFYIKHLNFQYHFKKYFRVIKIQLKYGSKYLSVEVNDIIHHRFDIILLKYFIGDHAVGLYSMIKNIFEGIMYIPKALRPIIIKELSRKNNVPYNFILSIYSILYLLGLIIVLFVGEWLIVITYGPMFIDAYIPLILVLIGGLFYSISFINNSFYMGINKFKYSIRASFITSITLICLGIILIPALDIYGASYSFLISSLIFVTYSFRHIKLVKNYREKVLR